MNWIRACVPSTVLAERAGQHRLAGAGQVLEQQVALGDQAGQRQPDHLVLAEQGETHVVGHVGEPGPEPRRAVGTQRHAGEGNASAPRGQAPLVGWRRVPGRPPARPPATGARTCSRWSWWRPRRWLGFWQLDAWQTRRAAEATDLTQVGPDAAGRGDRSRRPVPRATGRPAGRRRRHLAARGDRLRRPAGRRTTSADGVWVVTPVAVGRPGRRRCWSCAAGPPTRRRRRAAADRRRRAGRPGSSPPRAPARSTPTRPTTCCPRCGSPTSLQRVDEDLYGGVRRQPPTPSPGLGRGDRWSSCPPAGRFTALRNLLYALEWWVFGAFAAFIWWRYVRDQLAAEALAGAAEADAGTLGAVTAALIRYRVMASSSASCSWSWCWSGCRCTTATCCSPTRCPRAAGLAGRRRHLAVPRRRPRLALHDLRDHGLPALPQGRLGPGLHPGDAGLRDRPDPVLLGRAPGHRPGPRGVPRDPSGHRRRRRSR